ncbi:MAG: tripartite tricarboxylate transporter TctB family protein [Desulfobacterales bacterium]|nr:tripartite tricarboxylate transporter TctB family protein [Desulfobacterales bacterium]
MEKRAEIVCALFLLLLGVGFSIRAWNIPEPMLMQSVNTPPGFFPLLTGILFSVLSLIYLLSSILSSQADAPEESETFASRLKRMKPAFFILIILLAYIILLDVFGWLLCTFAMAFGVLVIAERATTHDRKIMKNLLLALVITVAMYLTFATFLGVMLPTPGLWGLENLIFGM